MKGSWGIGTLVGCEGAVQVLAGNRKGQQPLSFALRFTAYRQPQTACVFVNLLSHSFPICPSLFTTVSHRPGVPHPQVVAAITILPSLNILFPINCLRSFFFFRRQIKSSTYGYDAPYDTVLVGEKLLAAKAMGHEMAPKKTT